MQLMFKKLVDRVNAQKSNLRACAPELSCAGAFPPSKETKSWPHSCFARSSHPVPLLEVCIEPDDLILLGHAHAALRVLPHPLLEEVCLALEADHLHPLEGVGGAVVRLASECPEEAVGAELDVLTHEARVHPDQLHGERVRHKLLLDFDRVRDDLHDPSLRQTVDHLGVQEAREVAVHPLVAADELVREAQPRHEPPLLEPVDGAERSGEEYPLHGREGDHALGEGRVIGVAPLEGPVGLPPDARDRLYGAKQVHLLLLILDVGVDQQGVGLAVYVLHGYLEAVEAPGLRRRDLGREVPAEVLVDYSVGRGEEREDVGHEVPLVGGQVVPVLQVRSKVDLLGGPEGGLGLLVHLPNLWSGTRGESGREGGDDLSFGAMDEEANRNTVKASVSPTKTERHERNTHVVVLDGEQDESVGVLPQ